MVTYSSIISVTEKLRENYLAGKIENKKLRKLNEILLIKLKYIIQCRNKRRKSKMSADMIRRIKTWDICDI